MPLSTISLYFSASRRTCPITESAGELRLRPRTKGIMQKEQRLLQPSWILRMGRVWWDSPPWMGAERDSGWSKMLPVRIWAGGDFSSRLGVLPRAGTACRAPTKEWNGASGESGGKSRFSSQKTLGGGEVLA